jgi:hypothetical protein
MGGGCTAYLASNGTVLTAGHCADWDPDSTGPLLPDGVLDLWGVVEFNVPASQADGTPVAAAPNDQYPIDLSNVVWNFDGSGQGLGKDWAIFACLPNSNTGLLPHQAQGAFFRMTREAPPTDHDIRVTGYGIDSDPPGSTGDKNFQNVTLQTDAGSYVGERNSGANVWHEYVVDTRRASSGSPIIWRNYGFAIGIHTNGGCAPPDFGNNGTSFEHDPLENALQDFPGANTRYVDPVSMAPTQDGTIFQPYATILQAVNGTPTGGQISIVAGPYDEQITIDQAVTLIAPVGTVTIGQ